MQIERSTATDLVGTTSTRENRIAQIGETTANSATSPSKKAWKDVKPFNLG
jgi:hypothetical protein